MQGEPTMTMATTLRKREKGQRWRIPESALTVINPLNKVIEDSRGSVGVNLRRLQG
jgi:hypothetical protein